MHDLMLFSWGNGQYVPLTAFSLSFYWWKNTYCSLPISISLKKEYYIQWGIILFHYVEQILLATSDILAQFRKNCHFLLPFALGSMDMYRHSRIGPSLSTVSAHQYNKLSVYAKMLGILWPVTTHVAMGCDQHVKYILSLPQSDRWVEELTGLNSAER
jgi:hypothetical protein